MRRARLIRDHLSLRRSILALAAVLAINVLGLVAILGSTSDVEAQEASDTLTQSLWAGFNAVADLGPNADLVEGTFLSFRADPGENAESLNDLKVIANGIHREWTQAVPPGLPQHISLGPGFNFAVFTGPDNTPLADRFPAGGCINAISAWDALPAAWLGFPLGRKTGPPASFTFPTLPPGADIACAFTNTRRGSINITKDTQPDHAQDFDFEDDITGTINGSPDFTLDDDIDANLSNTKNFSQVVPNNTYTVSETAILGWTLSDITCTGPLGSSFIYRPSGGAPFAAGDTSVEITFAPGDIVNCTFTNANTPPVLAGGSTAAISIPENTTAVTDLDSSDPEGETEGSNLAYSLGGVDSGFFSIGANTGVLSFTSAPDFETPMDLFMPALDNVYQVTVTVTDSGGLTDTQTLTVTVTNTNEAPSLLNVPGMISLPENTPRVIQNIESSDPEDGTDEDGTLNYSLSGVDVIKFIIGEKGKFSFKAPFLPDYENPMDKDGNNVYEVTVIVTDSGGLTDTQDILVTITGPITDLNEAPSLLNVPGTISLPENTQRVIQNIESSDPEGDTEFNGLVYSISGADVAKFLKIGPGGKFSFRSPFPDFETPLDIDGNNVYEVTVTVTDSGGLTDTQDIFVTITDVEGM